MAIDEDTKRFIKGEMNFLKKVIAELEPLIIIIKEMPAESSELKLFRQAYLDYLVKEGHYKKISRYISKGILKPTGTRKDRLQFILWYIGILEAVNRSTINILIMVLNACRSKTKIINLENKRYSKLIENACTIEDLEKKFMPLKAKLDFIRANGLVELAAVVDADFRNDVVHFNFDVDGEDIIIDGKKIMPLVANNTFQLLRLSARVGDYLKQLAIEKRFFDIKIEI